MTNEALLYEIPLSDDEARTIGRTGKQGYMVANGYGLRFVDKTTDEDYTLSHIGMPSAEIASLYTILGECINQTRQPRNGILDQPAIDYLKRRREQLKPHLS